MKAYYTALMCGALLLLSSNALARSTKQISEAVELSQQVWLEKIEASLAETHTFRARFTQEAEQNGVSTGEVSLQRPGQMRFSYDPPSPLLLVASEGKVVFQDRSIGQITSIPVEHTPLGLLLRPDPRFSGDVSVIGFTQERNEIRLRVTKTDSPGEGEMTLYFSKKPLILKGWSVLDAQGHRTSVFFTRPQMGIKLSPSLFVLPKEED